MIRILLDKLYLFAGYAAGGFLIAIFVLMMLLSAGRPMGLNIPAGDDLVSWCMVATSFLGLAHTFRHGEMIRVGLLIDLLEGRTRHVIEIASLLVGGFFVAFFAYYAALLAFNSWRFHDMAQGVLAVPLSIPQLGYSGGLLILTDRIYRRIHSRRARQSATLREAETAIIREVVERTLSRACVQHASMLVSRPSC